MPDGAAKKVRRAFVVDDGNAILEYVSRVLQSARYQVETCGDGMAALEQYRAAPFDVVIVDVPLRVAVGHGRFEAAARDAGVADV